MGKRCSKAIGAAVALCIAVLAIAVPAGLAPDGGPASEGNRVGASQHESAVRADWPVDGPGEEPGDVSEGELGGQSNGEPDDAISAANEPSYDAETVLVSLAQGVTAGELADAFADFPVVKQGEGYVKVALPDGMTVDEGVRRLGASSLVDGAQPNYRYHTAASRSDAFGQLGVLGVGGAAVRAAGGLSSALPDAGTVSQPAALNDAYYTRQWALSSVHAPTAWDLVAAHVSAKSAITIAVIDEGFRADHVDLAGHVVDSYNVCTKSHALGTDHATHGTHVAGIVSAVANNGQGIAGVVGNTCGLMLLRVGDSKGKIETDTIVDAYTYLVKHRKAHNVRVVNMSLGAEWRSPVGRSTDPALYDAIAKARKAGIVTVVAASNAENYRPPFYSLPADFDNVVSVINLEQSGNSDGVQRELSSNYNVNGQKAKNISAPGTRIVSLGGSKASYRSIDGTSMASPLVAGVFGLMFTVNPKLTASGATSLLYGSARDLTACAGATTGWDRVTGYGEVDAEAAVRAAGATAGASAAGKENIASCTVAVKNATFTGKALKPQVKVANGSVTLREGVDYTVKYRDNKALGKAAVCVFGRGDYCGIALGTFTVKKAVPKPTSLKHVSTGAASLTARWARRAARTGGYQVQVAKNPAFSSGKVTVRIRKAGVTSTIVKGLASGQRYYIRVRTYKVVAGKTFHSPWSATRSVRVR